MKFYHVAAPFRTLKSVVLNIQWQIVAYKPCLLFERLEVRRCMTKLEEEKALNFHPGEYQFSSLT